MYSEPVCHGHIALRAMCLYQCLVTETSSRNKLFLSVRSCEPLILDITQSVMWPFDLHALSTPPAFILSQDQTLKTEKRYSEEYVSLKNKLKGIRRLPLHKAEERGLTTKNCDC